MQIMSRKYYDCYMRGIIILAVLLFSQVSWSGDINLNYFMKEESSYFLPIVSYEKDKLYLESRYNYEDFETLSFFVGRSFTIDDQYDFVLIPMLGGAGGNSDGIIPAFEFSVQLGKFNLSSQQEYLINLDSQDASFFYVWSDLTYEMLDWLNIGLSLQRLRPYQSTSDVDYGAFIGVQQSAWSFDYYYYLLGENDSMNILSLNYVY